MDVKKVYNRITYLLRKPLKTVSLPDFNLKGSY